VKNFNTATNDSAESTGAGGQGDSVNSDQRSEVSGQ